MSHKSRELLLAMKAQQNCTSNFESHLDDLMAFFKRIDSNMAALNHIECVDVYHNQLISSSELLAEQQKPSDKRPFAFFVHSN